MKIAEEGKAEDTVETEESPDFLDTYNKNFLEFKSLVNKHFSPSNTQKDHHREKMTVNLNRLTGLIMVRQSQISPMTKSFQEFVEVSGLVIKINPIENQKKIFLKLLSLEDKVHTYKVAACFFNDEDFQFAKNHLRLYDYVKTKPGSKRLFWGFNMYLAEGFDLIFGLLRVGIG